MATKISAMTAASTLDGTESVELVQGANSRKVVLDTALSDLNIVQQNASTGALEVGGTQIANTYTVADETALQALAKTSANDNLVALVLSPGHYRRYNHASGMWLADNPFILFHATYGTIAAPTETIAAGITAATLFSIPSVPTIPANMLRSGSIIGVNAKISRTGTAAAATVSVFLGTAGTDADSQIAAQSIGAGAATHTGNAFCITDFTSTTSVISVITQSWGGGSSADGGIKDKTTNINTASVMYISPGMGVKNTADTFSLQALTVWVYKI